MMSTTAVDRTVGLATASLRATAKINLTLDILGRRADGFHDLRSLVIGVDLCDRIRCTLEPEPGIRIDSSDPDLATPDNLAVQAASALANELSRSPALRLRIDKNIPVGGGLGGGSSDAVASLRLCDYLWGAGLSDDRLAKLGSSLGSDVPLFFHLPAALMEGRGERVREFPLAWSGWALLVNTGSAVSTPEVYQAHRVHRANGRRTAQPEEMQQLATASSAEELMSLTRNDLEPAIFAVAPDVERVWNQLHHHGLGPVRVSGAGSTLYRLFDREEDANRVSEEVIRQGIGNWAKVVAAPVGQQPIVIEES